MPISLENNSLMSKSSGLYHAIDTYLVTSAVHQNTRATLAVIEAINAQNRAVAQQQADAAVEANRMQIAFEQSKVIDTADGWVRDDPIIAVAITLWSQQILESNGVFTSAVRNLDEKAFIDRLYERSACIIDQCGDNVMQEYNLLIQKLSLLEAQRGYLINEMVAKTPVNGDIDAASTMWACGSGAVFGLTWVVAIFASMFTQIKFFWPVIGLSQIILIPLALRRASEGACHQDKQGYDGYRFWLPKILRRKDVIMRKDYWAGLCRAIAPNLDPGDRGFFEQLRQSIEEKINSHKPGLAVMLSKEWRWDAVPAEIL